MKIWETAALGSIVVGSLFAGACMHRVVAVEGGGVCRNQPHMQAALDHFRAARTELDRAEQNKGGWRDGAIAAADEAIRQTRAGCEFADTH